MINEPLKKPFAIYLDLECILKKLQSIQNNPGKSYTEKKARHEPSGRSIFIKCSFDKKNKNLITTEEKMVLKNYVKNEKKVLRK